MKSVHNIATYNRVPTLVSWLQNRFRPVAYGLLIFLISICILSLIIKPTAAIYTGILLAGLIICLIILSLSSSSHPLKCKFCATPLDKISRPLLLDAKLLEMNGSKHGDYYYLHNHQTLRPWNKKFVKISRYSLACHHCKLTEETVVESYQDITEGEFKKVTMPDSDLSSN